MDRHVVPLSPQLADTAQQPPRLPQIAPLDDVDRSQREASEQATNYGHIKQAIRSLKSLYEEVPGSTENEVFQKIKLEFTVSKSYLQLAASYSQFFLHAKALSCARKSLEYFDHLINNLQNLLDEKSLSLDQSFDLSAEHARVVGGNPGLKVQFLQFVHPAKRVIAIVDSLLKNLDSNNLDFNFKERFDELARVAAPESVRRVDTSWMDEISITNFMHVEYIKHQVISSSIQLDELYSDSFLAFIVMLAAVVLFTVATENRFLLMEQLGSAKDSSFKIKPIFEKTQQQRVRKLKRFVFSEKVHAKAAQLLGSFLKENHLHQHLVNSYRKNYESARTLEEIVSSAAGGGRLLPQLNAQQAQPPQRRGVRRRRGDGIQGRARGPWLGQGGQLGQEGHWHHARRARHARAQVQDPQGDGEAPAPRGG